MDFFFFSWMALCSSWQPDRYTHLVYIVHVFSILRETVGRQRGIQRGDTGEKLLEESVSKSAGKHVGFGVMWGLATKP